MFGLSDEQAAALPLAGLTGTTGLLVLWAAFAGGYMAARAVTFDLIKARQTAPA